MGPSVVKLDTCHLDSSGATVTLEYSVEWALDFFLGFSREGRVLQ